MKQKHLTFLQKIICRIINIPSFNSQNPNKIQLELRNVLRSKIESYDQHRGKSIEIISDGCLKRFVNYINDTSSVDKPKPKTLIKKIELIAYYFVSDTTLYFKDITDNIDEALSSLRNIVSKGNVLYGSRWKCHFLDNNLNETGSLYLLTANCNFDNVFTLSFKYETPPDKKKIVFGKYSKSTASEKVYFINLFKGRNLVNLYTHIIINNVKNNAKYIEGTYTQYSSDNTYSGTILFIRSDQIAVDTKPINLYDHAELIRVPKQIRGYFLTPYQNRILSNRTTMRSDDELSDWNTKRTKLINNKDKDIYIAYPTESIKDPDKRKLVLKSAANLEKLITAFCKIESTQIVAIHKKPKPKSDDSFYSSLRYINRSKIFILYNPLDNSDIQGVSSSYMELALSLSKVGATRNIVFSKVDPPLLVKPILDIFLKFKSSSNGISLLENIKSIEDLIRAITQIECDSAKLKKMIIELEKA